MRKRKSLIIGIIVVFVVLIFVVIGCQSVKKTNEANQKLMKEYEKVVEQKQQSPEQKKVTWQKVKSWSGTGIKNTEPFTITGKQWRVVWSIKDTTGYGAAILQVYVKKPGVKLFNHILVNITGTASDVTYFYESGEFYLEIYGGNGDWSISVEELK